MPEGKNRPPLGDRHARMRMGRIRMGLMRLERETGFEPATLTLAT